MVVELSGNLSAISFTYLAYLLKFLGIKCILYYIDFISTRIRNMNKMKSAHFCKSYLYLRSSQVGYAKLTRVKWDGIFIYLALQSFSVNEKF